MLVGQGDAGRIVVSLHGFRQTERQQHARVETLMAQCEARFLPLDSTCPQVCAW